jgi:photosystem II stability/assembly factor-like uncharacterized protein
MKKFLKIVSLFGVALFFVACSDTPSEGFSKTGKAGSLNVTYSSAKPLVVGDNTINVKITENGEVGLNEKNLTQIYVLIAIAS